MKKHNLLIIILSIFWLLGSAVAQEFEPQNMQDVFKTYPERLRNSSLGDDPTLILFDSSFQLIAGILYKTKDFYPECVSNEKTNRFCINEHFKAELRTAYQNDEIDEIEFRALKKLSDAFRWEGEKLKANKKFKYNRYYPDLGNYLKSKNFLTKKRQLKGEGYSENLSKEVKKTFRRYYPRKMKKFGKVGIDEYVLANYTRQQIGELANIYKKLITIMNANNGKVVLRSDRRFDLEEELKILRLDLSKKAMQIAYEAETEEEIAQLEKEIEIGQQRLQKLKNEIEETYDENEDLLKKARSDLEDLIVKFNAAEDEDEKYDIADQIWVLEDRINSLEQETGKNRFEITLDHGAIYNLAINYLNVELEKARLEGTLAGTYPSAGDVVAAAYLTGELDDKTLIAMLGIKEMHEQVDHPAKGYLRVAWAIGKVFLMANPMTSPYATIGIIIYESIQQARTYEKQNAKKTTLI